MPHNIKKILPKSSFSLYIGHIGTHVPFNSETLLPFLQTHSTVDWQVVVGVRICEIQ